MKYTTLNAFQKHVKETGDSFFSPVYLLVAKDPFLRQLGFQFLSSSFQKKNGKDFDLLQVSSEKLDKEKLSHLLTSPSLFSKMNVLHIKEAEKLKKEEIECLTQFFSKDIHDTYLILSAENFSSSSEFYSFIEKKGIVLWIEEPKPWEKEKNMQLWIQKRFISFGIHVSSKAASFLMQRVGSDFSFLQNEIEKLCCFASDKKEITEKEIEELCAENPTTSIWKWIDAIFLQNFSSVLEQGFFLFQEGFSFLALLKTLRGQLQTKCLLATRIQQGAKMDDLQKEFPSYKKFLSKEMEKVKQFSLQSFLETILLIDETEEKIKQIGLDEQTLFESFVGKLFLKLKKIQ